VSSPRRDLNPQYDEVLPQDCLSYGTREQVITLLRLAMGVLWSNGERKPCRHRLTGWRMPTWSGCAASAGSLSGCHRHRQRHALCRYSGRGNLGAGGWEGGVIEQKRFWATRTKKRGGIKNCMRSVGTCAPIRAVFRFLFAGNPVLDVQVDTVVVVRRNGDGVRRAPRFGRVLVIE
jgi:hypothetical protein